MRPDRGSLLNEYTDIAVVGYGQAFCGAIRPLVVGRGARGCFWGWAVMGPGRVA